MEGAHAQLPSGRRTDDPALGQLATTTVDEASWLVARFMFSHSQSGEYLGSVGSAMKMIWPHQPNDSIRRGVTSGLKSNGFLPMQRGDRFYWRVPAVFPAWQDVRSSRSGDDGSQTTGGPVTIRRTVKPHEVWTKQMIALAKAIEAHPGLHPREYAVMLDRPSVTWVAGTLRKLGYVISRGERSAARYYPTSKPWPAKLKIKPQPAQAPLEIAQPAPPPPPPPAPRQEPAQAPQEPAAATNGAKKVYHLPDGFYVVTGHVERLEVATLGDDHA